MASNVKTVMARNAMCCPFHDIPPVCECVTLRESSVIKYCDKLSEHEYKINGISYYRIKCECCSSNTGNVDDNPEMVHVSLLLAVGVHADKKVDAIKKWNSLVGDIQVDRLESIVASGSGG